MESTTNTAVVFGVLAVRYIPIDDGKYHMIQVLMCVCVFSFICLGAQTGGSCGR